MHDYDFVIQDPTRKRRFSSVDSATCLIEQENDPTQLRNPSHGKLVRFLVESSDHINAGEHYAEIEDDIAQFVKNPGVSLEAGDILGILTFDDPARVKHAKPVECLLPPTGIPAVVGNLSHQCMQFYLDVLNDILDGYDNQAAMASTLKDLDVLQNPELLSSEATAILSTLSDRLLIRATVLRAPSRTNIGKVMAARRIFELRRLSLGLRQLLRLPIGRLI
ncbi:hypothetical protein VTO73DRAFT_14449 [Trametes versicolor]